MKTKKNEEKNKMREKARNASKMYLLPRCKEVKNENKKEKKIEMRSRILAFRRRIIWRMS
jgi:hypothetical protein